MAAPAAAQPAAPQCTPDGTIVRLPGLGESSGVAASRKTRGAWTHNDSGQPELVSLDERGAVVNRVRVSGAKVDDWEAIASGPCPAGACLYLADIGDNNAKRKRITIYRLAEPEPASGTAAVEDVFHASYPDGAHDAETLLVTPKGEIAIVTKGDTGPVAIYRFPANAKPGADVKLERIGDAQNRGKASADARVTDGAVSPDGQWIVLRTKDLLLVYAASELMSGQWRERGRIDLHALGEPQGEGVTFAGSSLLYLTGEGGGKKQPGTFARMRCTF